MADTIVRLPADVEEKIARARVPSLIRSIASAENRAVVARARGKSEAAAEAERESFTLRAALARLVDPAACVTASPPEDAAAGSLGQTVSPGAAALADLRRDLAEDETPPLQWPEPPAEEAPAAPEVMPMADETSLPSAEEAVPEAAIGPVLTLPGDLVDAVAADRRRELREAGAGGGRRIPRRPTLAVLDRRPMLALAEASP